MLDRSFFTRDALDVARTLIGVELMLDGVGGAIVETEAYVEDDPASHSFGGMRTRNRHMWSEPGTAYVYKIYGIHFCLNAVCVPGSAVLIRALVPTRGIDVMQERRGVENTRLLCAGPGRLAQALAIDASHNGRDMLAKPFRLLPPGEPPDIAIGTRIGITKAAHQPWRFGLKGSPYLSRKF
jgi:DNA-3-methyladenine glycosylase